MSDGKVKYEGRLEDLLEIAGPDEAEALQIAILWRNRAEKAEARRDETLLQFGVFLHVVDAALAELAAGRNPSTALGPSYVAARSFVRGAHARVGSER